MKYYSQGNKASKLLASQLRQHQQKNKIPKLIHHNSNKVIINPQEIVDTFAQYYEALYNLKDDKNTPQPDTNKIKAFLEISPPSTPYL